MKSAVVQSQVIHIGFSNNFEWFSKHKKGEMVLFFGNAQICLAQFCTTNLQTRVLQ